MMLPTSPGTYILILRATTARAIRVGSLGKLQLQPGWFLYVGSAFGTGGLRARIRHHARRTMRPHWHIDYLRRYARLEAVWHCCGVRCEHEWAAALSGAPGVAIVLPGFGSSDCRCETHLFWFAQRPGLQIGAGQCKGPHCSGNPRSD